MASANADSAARSNAIYYVPEVAKHRDLADVPAHTFADEQRRALDPACPTGLIALDLSRELGLPWAASTPFMLARYVVVRAGEKLEHAFQASGEVYYVIEGVGTTAGGDGAISWKTGDSFVLPGANGTSHTAKEHAVLFVVTDEPQLAYLGLPAPDARSNPHVKAALFDGALVDEKLQSVHARSGPQLTPGKAVVFTTEPLLAMRSVLPSITAALNTLEPGGDQRRHRHNGCALTLAISGEQVHTTVGDKRVDWIPSGVMVTPPQAPHSHHNRGHDMMKCFVVQDAGLYYAMRNPGAAFE
jgi:gentisate 1,2-dioxygenase